MADAKASRLAGKVGQGGALNDGISKAARDNDPLLPWMTPLPHLKSSYSRVVTPW